MRLEVLQFEPWMKRIYRDRGYLWAEKNWIFAAAHGRIPSPKPSQAQAAQEGGTSAFIANQARPWKMQMPERLQKKSYTPPEQPSKKLDFHLRHTLRE